MEQEIIYHYTSSEGLIGILRNQHIRMTNVKFLNDSKELVHGVDLAKQHLKEAIEELKETNENINTIANSLSPLSKGLFSLGALNKHPPQTPAFPSKYRFTDIAFGQLINWVDTLSKTAPFYTASFCKKGNILRQWMAYCPEGGYAIGFNFSKLKNNCLNETNIDIRAVDYYGKKKLLKKRYEQIKKIALGYSSLLDSLLIKYPDTKELFDSTEYKNGSDKLSEKIKSQAFLIARASLAQKEKHFIDEEEIRLTLSNIAKMDILNENSSAIDFFPKNNLLVPYIPYTFPKDIIEKIYVGPMQNQELACNSLKKLKFKEDYTFKIERSKIPIRKI